MPRLLTAQNIVLKKIPQKPRNDKPQRLPIPHALYHMDESEICLFVKDKKGAMGVKGCNCQDCISS